MSADASTPVSKDSSPAAASGSQQARGALLLSALLFGAMAVSARGAAAELSGAQVAFVRFAIGLLVVLGLRAVRPEMVRVTRPGILVARGVLGGCAVLLYFSSIARLPVGLATLLNYTFPLWAAVFAAFFLQERIGLQVGAGMLLATAGLVVVVGPSALVEAVRGAGDPAVAAGLLAGGISSIFGGAATTAVRSARRTETAWAIFGAFCLGGMVVCAPFALADWRPVSAHTGLLLVLAGLFSVGAQVLFSWSLGFVTAGAGSLSAQLTVVASYALAAVVLGEPVGVNALVGGGIVMAGVFLAGR